MALGTPIVVQNELGIDLTQTYAAISASTPEYPGLPFAVGTKIVATNGSSWIFVTAGATLTLYNTLWIDINFSNVQPIGGAGAAPELQAGQVGFLQYVPAGNASATTIASGVSFWAMVSGEPTCQVASAGVGAALYSSDTAGALSGTVNTASHRMILGLTCSVTASGSTASNTVCFGAFPVVTKALTIT